jgi:hypothetical protein
MKETGRTPVERKEEEAKQEDDYQKKHIHQITILIIFMFSAKVHETTIFL